MKFKYIGTSPKTVNGRPVNNGDILDLPDNFAHRQFECLKKKPVIKKYNDLKIKKKIKRIRRKKWVLTKC